MSWTCRVARGAFSVKLRIVPVGGPFPYAAAHRVQAVSVGRERPHWRDREGIIAIAVATAGSRRLVAPRITLPDESAPRRLLPFCLSRQPVMRLAARVVLAQDLDVLPRDAHCRLAIVRSRHVTLRGLRMCMPITGPIGTIVAVLQTELVLFGQKEKRAPCIHWSTSSWDTSGGRQPIHEFAIARPTHRGLAHPETVEIDDMDRALIRVAVFRAHFKRPRWNIAKDESKFLNCQLIQEGLPFGRQDSIFRIAAGCLIKFRCALSNVHRPRVAWRLSPEQPEDGGGHCVTPRQSRDLAHSLIRRTRAIAHGNLRRKSRCPAHCRAKHGSHGSGDCCAKFRRTDVAADSRQQTRGQESCTDSHRLKPKSSTRGFPPRNRSSRVQPTVFPFGCGVRTGQDCEAPALRRTP